MSDKPGDGRGIHASPDAQINSLANFIMRNVPGEPSRNEGAVDCAIRIIRAYKGRCFVLDGDCAALAAQSANYQVEISRLTREIDEAVKGERERAAKIAQETTLRRLQLPRDDPKRPTTEACMLIDDITVAIRADTESGG